MSESVYIVAAKRTPIGSFCGALKTVPAAELAGIAIKGALAQAGLSPDKVNEVIVGNVVSAGQGMGVGRQAALAAGIPAGVPAYTLNMVCGSGMKTLMDACAHIKAGDAEVVVAAGCENMSQIPFVVKGDLRGGNKMGDMALSDLLISDGLTDVFNKYHMGVTAENVVAQEKISRDEQDALAVASQAKAVAAIEAGHFKAEIVPVEVKSRKETLTVDTDEYPKAGTTLETLAKLRPAFKPDGSVTAGNASGINDGGSAIIVASKSAVEKYGLTPLAEVVSYGQGGIDPEIMGLGPVPAIDQALSRGGLKLEQMERLELNEAFAGQALGVVRQLSGKYDIAEQALLEKTNMNGGAIALGHPLGASGNRILVTLLYELQRSGSTLGLASLCVGGGMGTAVVLKRV
ncbi:acetyl-CoA acetyltransferase [Zobellella denitrificans]|jgi:acetyl-CoA C-acetyltransferase|uniref:Acetyl-CoA acetyltransferase n=1 Tax=Zobellella denitrificans TaxID=347534 RepID=A0A231N1L3_9GAMM|nr:acetyl-CoA C-acetyltransferase [Zobellella denitrificans]ATG74464.1 acetyl-CoA acetyltransferase [Zobellella denitrificans]OXS16377.1 acetyl-CoA acetyltransferase [Zobellella denitrificans]